MTNDIVLHSWNKSQIPQMFCDTQVGKSLVPAGYVNATKMCKACGKLWADYARLESTKAYWNGLSKHMGIPIDLLVISSSNGKNSERGTWVHPEIAIDLAQWVSVEFRIWANATLREVMESAKLAQERKRQQLRLQGKLVRRNLTDSIKEYIDRHPELSENKRRWMYTNASELINLAVFGCRSKKVAQKLGCKPEQIREIIDWELALKLQELESATIRRIDERDQYPLEAIKEAAEALLIKPDMKALGESNET